MKMIIFMFPDMKDTGEIHPAGVQIFEGTAGAIGEDGVVYACEVGRTPDVVDLVAHRGIQAAYEATGEIIEATNYTEEIDAEFRIYERRAMSCLKKKKWRL